MYMYVRDVCTTSEYVYLVNLKSVASALRRSRYVIIAT